MASSGLSENDIATIRGISQIHAEKQLAQDWDGWMATCAKDVTFLPPDSPKIEGWEAAREWIESFPVAREVSWTVESVEGNGDIATSRGFGPMTLEIGGNPVRTTVKWLSVFKRQADGSWKLKELAWNANEPFDATGGQV